MKKLYVLAILLLSSLPLYSLEETIVIGIDDKWESLESTENIIFTPSTSGNYDIVLQENEYFVDYNTDLLLHFNKRQIYDHTKNYVITDDSIMLSDSFSRSGTGAAVFRGERPGLQLEPAASDSLLSPGQVWSDFTIDFWLYPASMKNGETIFLFKGSRITNSKIISQRIECKFENNRLEWIFENIFLPESMDELTISISGKSMLVPRNWHHHQLTFNSETGLLEYMLDGIPEGIAYANKQNKESGTVYLPYIGSAEKGSLILGIGLTAFLDEFRISSSVRDIPELSEYNIRYGEIITDYIDLGFTNSEIINISADYEKDSNSEILFYYRTSNDYGEFISDTSGWIQFDPDSLLLSAGKARYIQIKCHLFPDGTQTFSPKLSNLKIHYIPDLPPLPPSFITAVPGDKSIKIRWPEVAEEDVAGYLIYFGERPGQYLGSFQGAGNSPVNAGDTNETTIEGLENGKLYYFAVCAYDSSAIPHVSGFSTEISARPSGLYGE